MSLSNNNCLWLKLALLSGILIFVDSVNGDSCVGYGNYENCTNGMSDGAIIGMSFGIVVCFIGIIVVIIICCRGKRTGRVYGQAVFVTAQQQQQPQPGVTTYGYPITTVGSQTQYYSQTQPQQQGIYDNPPPYNQVVHPNNNPTQYGWTPAGQQSS